MSLPFIASFSLRSIFPTTRLPSCSLFTLRLPCIVPTYWVYMILVNDKTFRGNRTMTVTNNMWGGPVLYMSTYLTNPKKFWDPRSLKRVAIRTEMGSTQRLFRKTLPCHWCSFHAQIPKLEWPNRVCRLVIFPSNHQVQIQDLFFSTSVLQYSITVPSKSRWSIFCDVCWENFSQSSFHLAQVAWRCWQWDPSAKFLKLRVWTSVHSHRRKDLALTNQPWNPWFCLLGSWKKNTSQWWWKMVIYHGRK